MNKFSKKNLNTKKKQHNNIFLPIILCYDNGQTDNGSCVLKMPIHNAV